MRPGRPRFFRWAVGVAGTTFVLVIVPLLVQFFYDAWFKAHLPFVANIYSFRWTPTIITIVGFLLMAALLVWPDLMRSLVRPDQTKGGGGRRTIYKKGTYLSDGTVTIESWDVVEGAADEALNDDAADVPPGDVLD